MQNSGIPPIYMIEQVDRKQERRRLCESVESEADMTYSHQVTSGLHEYGANTDTGGMGTVRAAQILAQMYRSPCRRILRGNLLSWVQNIVE